ncbi:MAG: phosphoenolpyruvate carboxykinase, partial [Woeseiaceae bacterium]|nr:phosphoenolpyruvate carboxykinase [Woeseiaceae bacterium]
MTTTLSGLQNWVDSVAAHTRPDAIYWCDGSVEEYDRFIAEMCESGVLSPLDAKGYPDCYLHLSDPSDVARVEHLTFICTRDQEDAGPNNHWMEPGEAHEKIDALFDGAMEGRTL